MLAKILDPVVGGKARVIVALLSAVAAGLASPSVADLGWTWVPPVLATVNFALSALAHHTPVGNKPAEK